MRGDDLKVKFLAFIEKSGVGFPLFNIACIKSALRIDLYMQFHLFKPLGSRLDGGSMTKLASADNEIAKAIKGELERQRNGLEMIASENYCSLAVLEAQGSVLTNKYAEGYPQKRWYNGCEYMDIVESLAIQRAKELFNAEYANVQPHSGSQANMAAYFALLNPGDKIMAMSLDHGGHLTHGIE